LIILRFGFHWVTKRLYELEFLTDIFYFLIWQKLEYMHIRHIRIVKRICEPYTNKHCKNTHYAKTHHRPSQSPKKRSMLIVPHQPADFFVLHYLGGVLQKGTKLKILFISEIDVNLIIWSRILIISKKFFLQFGPFSQHLSQWWKTTVEGFNLSLTTHWNWYHEWSLLTWHPLSYFQIALDQ